MKFSHTCLSVALAGMALAAPAENVEKRAVPHLYLAGDSTMALGGGGTGTQGWGEYIGYSLKDYTVVNDAHAGTSARSYTDTGRFTTIIDAVVAGDTVIIEFGHNDGGSLTTTDNGRTDCYGSGTETCITTAGVVVQTYVTYLTNAAKAMVAKGAYVIIASPTPDNVCETLPCSYTAPRFTAYGKQVVANVGSGASFIDHGLYVANRWIALGATVVDTYFPIDHTHTSPIGADGVAGQFIKAALCAGNGYIVPHIKNTTASVVGTCV